MGDNHDRGQLADVIPDAAIWVRSVLSARCGPEGSYDRPHLSRRGALRVDPSCRLGSALALPVHRDDCAGLDPELI